MTSSDRTTQSTSYAEEGLRRQLRWIEDDIVITLLGSDTPTGSADNIPQPPSTASAFPVTRLRSTGLLTRLRHWFFGMFRRIMALFQ